MKCSFKYIGAVIFLLTIHFFANSQVYVKASVDKNKIVIGEPITFTLEAYIPLGQQVTWFPLDTIPHFEFLQKPRPDTVESIEGKKITQVMTITSFDSGQWEIPQLELKVLKQSYYTATCFIASRRLGKKSCASILPLTSMHKIMSIPCPVMICSSLRV